MTHVSYTDLRQNLSRYLDEAVNARAPIVVTRQGGKGNVVMISEAEFAGWQETVHLLSSPRNAERLLRGVRQAETGARGPRSATAQGRCRGVNVHFSDDGWDDYLHWTPQPGPPSTAKRADRGRAPASFRGTGQAGGTQGRSLGLVVPPHLRRAPVGERVQGRKYQDQRIEIIQSRYYY